MSTTYIAGIVSILTLALPVLGIHVADAGTFTGTVTGFFGVFASVYVLYGRYKAGGINAFGIRK